MVGQTSNTRGQFVVVRVHEYLFALPAGAVTQVFSDAEDTRDRRLVDLGLTFGLGPIARAEHRLEFTVGPQKYELVVTRVERAGWTPGQRLRLPSVGMIRPNLFGGAFVDTSAGASDQMGDAGPDDQLVFELVVPSLRELIEHNQI